MWNSRRKMFDFNCKVVFHLEGSFMSSLLLLIQPKRKKKQILLLLFLFQWWNAKGSHFCWNQVTSYMKTQKPCRIQALSGPGSLGAKISQNLRQTARGHPWSSSGQLTHPIARTRLLQLSSVKHPPSLQALELSHSHSSQLLKEEGAEQTEGCAQLTVKCHRFLVLKLY